ncbi:MAG TPA: hypothetical protein VJG30_03615 [Candidatus Nanoarchaeia archaeon]|nr:hypothetical protein [Candidatus Nanoarchaeia archaeon]
MPRKPKIYWDDKVRQKENYENVRVLLAQGLETREAVVEAAWMTRQGDVFDEDTDTVVNYGYFAGLPYSPAHDRVLHINVIGARNRIIISDTNLYDLLRDFRVTGFEKRLRGKKVILHYTKGDYCYAAGISKP